MDYFNAVLFQQPLTAVIFICIYSNHLITVYLYIHIVGSFMLLCGSIALSRD